MIERKIFENVVKTNLKSLELMISPKCNLSCDYCYMRKYNSDHPSVITIDLIKNSINLFKSLHDDGFELSLFGGDPTLQLDLINYILEKYENDNQIEYISFPSNGLLISQNPKVFRELLTKFPKLRISFSIDGPYCDPIQRKNRYNEAINYNSLFEINRDFLYQTGFHPMVYAKTVDKLYDTLRWFIENINDNEQVENRVSFLPVRNINDWNDKNLKIFKEQLTLCKEYLKQNQIILKDKKFNLFNRTTISRGVTCSLQSNLHVDWNGNVWPCHRLMYPEFLIGNINNYPDWNFNRILPFFVYHRNNNLLCAQCSIFNTEQCLGGCLGANYERWGDPFIHVPSVCKLLQVLYEEAIDD